MEEDLVKKDDINITDSLNIKDTGSLLEDIAKIEENLTNIDVKIKKVPELELKKITIKDAGNFLNVKENNINMPIEMIVFPFFTYQKQNKRVNFEYNFENMGVKMNSTLILQNSSDKIFQPSTFEEKIYTYLMSMYEAKKEIDDKDEYIEFEISDFITNFLGNKMNRAYYTKVEQALKNLKSTEYQFVISNHTKLGKYKFEDTEFKLLSYQKLSRGKKRYYRITLNKNIKQKIKQKRYIIFSSKAFLEILEKDPIASRIYRFISQIRYQKLDGRTNLKTLAAIIPLRIEQATIRKNKNGEEKEYYLSRLKQVRKRLEKAFEVLKNFGYILEYSFEYANDGTKEGTYYFKYKFNPEKDGKCHISSYLIPMKEKTAQDTKEEIEDIEIVEEEYENIKSLNTVVKKAKIKQNTKEAEIIFNNDLNEKIIKVKKNMFVKKAWDKRADTKILKIYEENGADIAKNLLNILYRSLREPIKTTLVKYMNGILKNLEEKAKNKKQKTLFEPIQNIKENEINLNEKTDIKEGDTTKEQDIFLNMDEFERNKTIEEATELLIKKTNMPREFFIKLDKNSAIFLNTIKPYVKKILEKRKEAKEEVKEVEKLN